MMTWIRDNSVTAMSTTIGLIAIGKEFYQYFGDPTVNTAPFLPIATLLLVTLISVSLDVGRRLRRKQKENENGEAN